MKYLYLILALLIACPPLIAQVPQGINFQSVARDASGIPLSVTPLVVRFSIQNAANTTIYQETQATTTDVYGLFNLIVGQGTPTLGSFAAITWGASNYQVEIEIDTGTGFVSLGTCVFQSVPYALYAEQVDMGMEDLNNVDLFGPIRDGLMQQAINELADIGLFIVCG